MQFDHLGARDADNTLAFRPYVANLSRNVVLRSENPLGVRGHTLFSGRGNIDIQFAEFRDLGRTTNAIVDSTQFDVMGNRLTLVPIRQEDTLFTCIIS